MFGVVVFVVVDVDVWKDVGEGGIVLGVVD